METKTSHFELIAINNLIDKFRKSLQLAINAGKTITYHDQETRNCYSSLSQVVSFSSQNHLQTEVSVVSLSMHRKLQNLNLNERTNLLHSLN